MLGFVLRFKVTKKEDASSANSKQEIKIFDFVSDEWVENQYWLVLQYNKIYYAAVLFIYCYYEYH